MIEEGDGSAAPTSLEKTQFAVRTEPFGGKFDATCYVAESLANRLGGAEQLVAGSEISAQPHAGFRGRPREHRERDPSSQTPTDTTRFHPMDGMPHVIASSQGTRIVCITDTKQLFAAVNIKV
jgi:hypothetical protein